MDERTSIGLVAGAVVLSLGLGAIFYRVTEPDVPLVPQQLEGPITILPAVTPQSGTTFIPVSDRKMTSLSLPGDWGRFEQGQLRPSVDLRVRFDHLLARRAEQPLLDMHRSVQAMATQDLGAEGGLAVAKLWDIYLNLLIREEEAQNREDTKADTPEKWIESRLNFFNQARTRLGSAWEEVLFAEDEHQVRQLLQGLRTPKAQAD